MIRSATLALSIITPISFIALCPLQDSVFHGNEDHSLWFAAGLGAWLGWTVPLLAVRWWLARKQLATPTTVSQQSHEQRV